MSSKQEDENYWNQSDYKAFSFDDEDLNSNSRFFGPTVKSSFITDIIFEGVPLVGKPETDQRPLETLISKYSLNKILEEDIVTPKTKISAEEELKILRREINNKWTPPNVSKTIKLILTGRQYSLHLYKSLDLKKELLDAAIDSGDGNAIISVVIFLSTTLKNSLFYQILQTKPVAVSHYVQYLTTRLMVSELIDLLEMVGQTREAAMKQYAFIIEGIPNTESKLRKLNACYDNHFSLIDSKDKKFVEDYIKYLNWVCSLDNVTDKTLLGSSVVSSLHYLCKYYWNEPKTSKNSPWFLLSNQSISDRQFQWVALTSRASLQSWEDIQNLFLTKGWIGGKKLKSVIGIEKIIIEINKQGAPYNILSLFLEVISAVDKRLELAKQLPCHKAVVDIYTLMKDRQGIIEYKVNLKPQSEEYLYAENALRP